MKVNRVRRIVLALALVASAGFLFGLPAASPAGATNTYVSGGSPGIAAGKDTSAAASLPTATPIKHVVVIFQENISFDHYFATYPYAANPPGEPPFTPAANTPTVNGLSGPLLTQNPNLVQPFRLDRTQALTCDQNHDYTAEQKAFDNGRMDKFVQYTDAGGGGNSRQYCPKGVVMGYYDGNTVTGLWNYAQNYAMNDNSFDTVFGPSSPGAINVTVGDTGGAVCGNSAVYNAPAPCSPSTNIPASLAPGTPSGTVYGDPDQYFDDYSSGGFGSKNTAALVGRNIGDMLNAAGVTWGWFNGGFDSPNTTHNLVAVDRIAGVNPATDTTTQTSDYSAHHEPFQYFASTSNPHHVVPSSVAMIGQTDQANHQYDLTDFWAAADAGNLPAVSYLKAPKYQDGHAGYSDPLDEQEYIVSTINHLETLPSWNSTAVIIGYDDSDGWYDHVMGPIVNHSNTPKDVNCGSTTDGAPARCGYGPRLPYLVISPYAKTNFVDHTLTDQSSSLRFIEDNWLGGQRVNAESFDNKAGTIMGMFDFSRPVGPGAHRLFLNPVTGEPRAGGSFTVTFTSTYAGQGEVYFGPGTSCSGLNQVATVDQGSGTTSHTIVVTGNDLSTGTDTGIVPGGTYSFMPVTVSGSTIQFYNNGGPCYTVIIPKS